MARDFNQFRNASAKLARKTIDKLGTTFAIEYGLDGFSAVNNVVAPMPNDIKEYLEGDTSITVFACASNIDKLCEYALTSFPNIEDLYLFKTSAIVVLEDDLSYLLDLNKIYVPSDLLSAYLSAYPTLSSKFDTIVEDYTLTIPFIGETTLTSEYVDSVIAMLSNAEKNAITKLVIPTDFSEESANPIAWGYDFSAIVNLNNNIWYGATQYDFSVWTIEGSGELTSTIVDNQLNTISSNNKALIEKVIIPLEFTSYASGSFAKLSDNTYLTNLRYIKTTYELGPMELDLQGDIVAKIVSIGKTLDEALIRTRPFNASNMAKGTTAIIIPPTNAHYVGNSNNSNLTDSGTLVYVADLKNAYNFNPIAWVFSYDTNLIELNATIKTTVWGGGNIFIYSNSVKRFNLDFSNVNISTSTPSTFNVTNNLTKAILTNITGSFIFSSTTGMTEQAFIDLFNSLGTPATQQTIKLTSTDLAKLSAETIAIATAKNWVVQ